MSHSEYVSPHREDDIDFKNFSLGDLIWITNHSVCKYNRKLAFEAMLKHPNKSVKYIYDLYKTTADLELKELARRELKKGKNMQVLFVVGVLNKEGIQEILK